MSNKYAIPTVSISHGSGTTDISPNSSVSNADAFLRQQPQTGIGITFPSGFSICDDHPRKICTGLYSDIAWNVLSHQCSYNNVSFGSFEATREKDNQIIFNVHCKRSYFDNMNDQLNNTKDSSLLLKQIVGSYMAMDNVFSNEHQCVMSILIHGHSAASKIYGKKLVDRVVGQPLNQMEIELKDSLKEEQIKMDDKYEKLRVHLAKDREKSLHDAKVKIERRYDKKRKELEKKALLERKKLRRSFLDTVGKKNPIAKELIMNAIPLDVSHHYFIDSFDQFSFSNAYVLNSPSSKVFTDMSYGNEITASTSK